MPTITPIKDTLIPREPEKAIPVRVVSTRTGPRPKPADPAAGAAGAAPGTPEGAAAAAPAEPQGTAATGTNRDRPGTDRNDSGEAAPGAAESVKLSPQLSALARKEQAHRQREQALKEREKAVEARLAKAEKYDALEKRLAAKDYSALQELGLTYEQYAEYELSRLSGDKTDPGMKKLESEVEALKKNQEDTAQAQFDETVSEYRKEIAALVSKDPAFSTVKELKREDAVLQLILDSWEEDDEEVTVEQAAKDIEDFLVEEATRMASTTKVKARLGEGDKRPLPPPRPGLKTLTQQVIPSGEKRPLKSLQSMSESERYAEARRRVQERREQEQRNR